MMVSAAQARRSAGTLRRLGPSRPRDHSDLVLTPGRVVRIRIGRLDAAVRRLDSSRSAVLARYRLGLAFLLRRDPSPQEVWDWLYRQEPWLVKLAYRRARARTQRDAREAQAELQPPASE
jgi:hypothetical protein